MVQNSPGVWSLESGVWSLESGVWRAQFTGYTREYIRKIAIKLNTQRGIALPTNPWQAHHIFPVDQALDLERQFFQAGINIHDPLISVDLDTPLHQTIHASGYNRACELYFQSLTNQDITPTRQGLLNQAHVFAKQFNFQLPAFFPVK